MTGYRDPVMPLPKAHPTTRFDRTRMLGALAAGLLLSALPALVGLAQTQTATQKPNILFVMTDDVGWIAPGLYHRGLNIGATLSTNLAAEAGIDQVAVMVGKTLELLRSGQAKTGS